MVWRVWKREKGEKDTFGTIEAAKRIGISLERMYYWERKGVLKPSLRKSGIRKFRKYSLKDIQRALLVKDLVDREHYTLEGAIEKIKKQK